jgi:O-acetyl-ADP-ribose deacetylase (regulator of RNase III)
MLRCAIGRSLTSKPVAFSPSGLSMTPEIVTGDLLDQPVQVIVNAWNRNIIPWWLLVPQGVSGAIKRRGGVQPFIELARTGSLPLGHARLTGAGRLPYAGIIHVAGINMLWQTSETAIRLSVRNAMRIVDDHKFESVAFPLIGGGTGGMQPEKALRWMCEELEGLPSSAQVIVVRYAGR